ncbi:hypothetical protein PROSTU_04843 [Providencia stuartii ATCC 25827]|uniref:Uncharacterized protein n=1 Tax=Providencia stuartii ATCC 25827 TaxID=471874 RepID=A0AA86YER4_PROST|nr:hypothetical protein PROSTU_04843 [Providencia stuartii ATCC 25827]
MLALTPYKNAIYSCCRYENRTQLRPNGLICRSDNFISSP